MSQKRVQLRPFPLLRPYQPSNSVLHRSVTKSTEKGIYLVYAMATYHFNCSTDLEIEPNPDISGIGVSLTSNLALNGFYSV